MEYISIANNFFCIKQIFKVMRGKNKNHHKITSVNGRHSDAFVFVLSGECTYFLDNKSEIDVQAGDILYLSHRANYDMKVGEADYCYIFCDFQFDTDHIRQCELFTPESTSLAKNLFLKLLNIYRSNSSALSAELMSTLYSIYAVAIKSVETDDWGTAEFKVNKAKKHIEIHFNDINLSVSELAKMCGMSEVYFRKIFKKEYGQSPAKYITAIRLQKAKELMDYPFLQLEECALQSGFSSYQYFGRVFKENFGITPAKYRKTK